jgi:hypothetical protein
MPMRAAQVAALCWQQHPNNPLLAPPFPSPILASPTVLTPDLAPDGKFHLFAHSILGIHHFESSNGATFTARPGLVVRGAIRPFIHAEGGLYYLSYEKPQAWWPRGRGPWRSVLEARTSRDLVYWAPPTLLLQPSLPWHHEGSLGSAVGSPCLLKDAQGYRLFYSAGLTRIADGLIPEPRHLGVARGVTAVGPFVPDSTPLFSPGPADPWCNLAAGSMKVLAVEDGLVGFQNATSWNERRGCSVSTVRLLHAKEGEHFVPMSSTPMLAPSGGWMRTHVQALDVRRVGAQWMVWFGARNATHWLLGREHLGLCTAPAEGA